MPHAIKLGQKYGDRGLHVVLVEIAAPREKVVPFSVQAFPGSTALGLLGPNAPFTLPGDTIPKTALVGVDGKIVWSLDGGGSVEKVIEAELAKLHQVRPLEGPLKPLAKDLAARAFGKAVTSAREIAAKAAEGSKAKSDAEALADHVAKSVSSRFARAARLVAAGRLAKAKKDLALLAKHVAGDAGWTARAAEELKRLDAPDVAQELAADALVMAGEDLLKDRKSRAAAAAKFAEVAKKHPGAKVAKLAAELKAAAEAKDALR